MRRPSPSWLLILCLALLPLGVGGQDVFAEPDPEVVPVLLVPGWSDDTVHMEPLRRRFLDAGWPASRVRPVEFSNPVGSNRTNAEEIARAVDVLRGLTGVDRVDVVAHSMGGLAVRHFLQSADGESSVRRVVFLGTPHRGTVAAMLAWGEGGREMVPGSPFLTNLNEEAERPAEVEMLAIRTPVDLRIIPGSSAVLPGVLNLEVCCPTHTELVDDDEVFRRVEAFLREGREGVSDAEVPGSNGSHSGS